MAGVSVLLASGFEEIEAITIVDVLRRAEIDVTTLQVESAECLGVPGSHGVVVRADKTLKEAADETWDMIILPGGLPGATNLRDNAAVKAMIQRQHAAGQRVAAICAAPIALGAAGILEGKKATSYPGFEGELTGATCVTDRVVRDGNVITSRGPGTALEFALEIVRELRGDEPADALRKGMLVNC